MMSSPCVTFHNDWGDYLLMALQFMQLKRIENAQSGFSSFSGGLEFVQSSLAFTWVFISIKWNWDYKVLRGPNSSVWRHPKRAKGNVLYTKTGIQKVGNGDIKIRSTTCFFVTLSPTPIIILSIVKAFLLAFQFWLCCFWPKYLCCFLGHIVSAEQQEFITKSLQSKAALTSCHPPVYALQLS